MTRKPLLTVLLIMLMSGSSLSVALASGNDIGGPFRTSSPAVEDPHRTPLRMPPWHSDATDHARVTSGWTTIMAEDFEGGFPSGAWSVFDDDSSTTNECYWGKDDYKPHSGGWSAWAASGGEDGLDPEYYYYPSNLKSWMVYGPFDLSDAQDAELHFYYWNQSEVDHDWFGWYASADGADFHGFQVSGDSGGWKSENFDLTAVPTLGNLTGDSSVWIAFSFISDAGNSDDGPFVDDVILQKYVLDSAPNLRPHTPGGWDHPVVPSPVQGTHTVDPLCADGSTYVDWAVTGEEASTSTTFYTMLYVDDTPLQTWTIDGLDEGEYTSVEDWLLAPDSLTAGWHTLKIVADVYDDVAESNEDDNAWEQAFYWDDCVAPTSWLLLYTMSNGGNLEDGCEAKFRAIAQEADNPNFQAWVLWDHVTSEDRVYHMKNDSDWLNGYTRGVDTWTATDVGLGSDEMDTGDVATLNKFVDFALARQEADHYALIVFNHGAGVHPTALGNDKAITGICFDDQPSNYLSVQELGQGSAHLAAGIGRNFEILHLDACLMQMMEVNHEVHEHCDYVVASENVAWTWTGGTSWEAGYLDGITGTSTGQSLANSIATAYYNDFAPSGATVSVLRTAYAGGVSTAVDDLAQALITHMRTIRPTLQVARSETQKFAYYDLDNTMTEANIFLDLRDLATEVDAYVAIDEVDDAASAVVDAIGTPGGDFVVWEAHQNEGDASPTSGYWFDAGTSGVSIFFPDSVSPSGQGVYDNYVNDSATPSNLAFCSSTQWDEFLRAYLEWQVLKVSSSGAAAVDIACTSDELDRGDGLTTFTRLYETGASVSLTAPASAGGREFVRWDRNGSSYSNDRSISFSMSSDYDFEAVYGVPNTPPELAGLPDQALDEDTSLDDAVDLWDYGSDAETADSGLTFAIDDVSDSNAGVSVDSNRTIDIFPEADWCGCADVCVRVTDAGGLWDTDTFRVAVDCVNDAPGIFGLPDRSLEEDSHLDDAIDLWSFAHDEETSDGGLIFTIDNVPDANAGISIDANRYVDVDPAPDWTGTTSVRIKVTDPEGASDTDTFQVTVDAVNDAPWISPVVPDRSADEDVPITLDLATHEHDVESSSTELDWTVAGEEHCTVSGEHSDDDVLTFTPAADYFGPDTFVLTLIDPQGGSASQSVTLTWHSVNDPPTMRSLPDRRLDEDDSLDNAIDLWSYANDVETADGGLIFTIDNVPSANAGISIDSNRYVDVDPAQDWYGTTSVRIKVTDPEGASDTATFQVTVDPVNDAPWISPVVLDQTVDEDVPISVDLATHEHDVESSGTELDWTVTGEEHCTVSGENSDDDVLTFTPEADFYGSDGITLTLTDGEGARASQPLVLTWRPVNDAPWISPAVPDQTADEDVPISVGLAAYEHDVESSGTDLDWAVAGEDHCTVSGENGDDDVLTFTPESDYFGSETVLMTLTDPQGGSASQNVTLTWHSVNDPPTIDSIPNQWLGEGVPLGDVIDLWAYASDVETPDSGLIFAIDNEPDPNAGVSIDAMRYVDIRPVAGWQGTTSVRISVEDPQGASDTDTFLISTQPHVCLPLVVRNGQ